MPRSYDDPETQIATEAHRVASAPVERLRATVSEGPDAGQSFDLDPNAPSRILVGTSPVCAIRLGDPTVSRRHAAFEPTQKGGFRLDDLGSTNGTAIDGVRIASAFVRGGETIRFGSTAIALETMRVRGEPADLGNQMRYGRTFGASTAMRRLYPLCERIAKARVPCLIEGETGTGKEVLAESLHEMGGSRGPFVVFDCTTVSSQLIESELFGHVRGAFTGAERDRAGVFEEADGGTLLIDEIGDLDLPLQAKLLRLIDRGELRRVGGRQTIKVDVRVLSATRRDLDKEVAAGRFRDDLFHRLAVARVELPPLRDRHGDVPLLVKQFVKEMSGDPSLVAEILSRFADYTWPGNVRELRNLVARYVALGADIEMPVRAPPAASRSVAAVQGGGGDWLDSLVAEDIPFPIARRMSLEEFERRYVAAVLARHNGNVGQAAKASGLALRYFRLVRARQK
ncbi:MAG: sigma 54-interacting transcriptional regulator [Labilithrix sp.]|nr:sigma 54-interacting transcriptional regulator [Labilithrix sp.]MCW5810626.1 sigma 54-interacting transcriptional regulator [Labilithrix sp.]